MAQIIKIGNSQGIRIPKPIVSIANLENQELDFVLTKNFPFGGKIIQGYSVYFSDSGKRLDSGYFMLLFNI